MRILVTGSREWTDRDAVWGALLRLSVEVFQGDHLEPMTLIAGGARGLDTIALEIAHRWGWERERYETEWDEYPRPDRCLAFPLPGSVDTWDMIHKANAAGIEVRIVPSEQPQEPHPSKEPK